MCNHHPDASILRAYAQGDIEHSWAILVAAHVQYCRQCASRLRDVEEALAQAELVAANDSLAMTFDIESIMALPQQKPESSPTESTLRFREREIQVPRVLRKVIPENLNWSPTIGKLSYAPVVANQSEKIYLIHIGAGATVPQHSHKGNELTLVLDGRFEDSLGVYDTGDFIQLSHEHCHSPQTTDKEDCLVVSLVDAPLHFTAGWSRLINPLSHLFFR